MTLHGKIHNGTVVFDHAANLPEGTPVTVLVPSSGAAADSVSEEEHARRKAALAELLAMPNENPGDTFSGGDHDQVLYGDRE